MLRQKRSYRKGLKLAKSRKAKKNKNEVCNPTKTIES